MTAQQSHQDARPVGGTCLDWLRPAVEIAAPANWPLARVAAGRTGEARVATRTPGAAPGSVKTARDFAGATLRRWGVAGLTGDVGVVVSELLTNALRHALPARLPQASRIRVGLLYEEPCVLCAVADPSDRLPVMKDPDYLAETGRGLHVVAALSDHWGWTAPGGGGKVVWATFGAQRAT